MGTNLLTTSRTKFGSVDCLPSGRYRARYRRPETGEQMRVPGTFSTEKEARVRLKVVEASFLTNSWTDDRRGRVKFSTWATSYVENKEATWKPGTRRNNATLLRSLNKEFGSLALADITPWHVQRWWNTSAAHKVNRRNGYYLLRPILQSAVDARIIDRSPCQIANAGKDASKAKVSYEVEDFLGLLDHAPGHYATILWVLFGASLRISELRGLNVGDFDPKTGSLLVERQASDVGGNSLVSTKTGTTRRVILLEPARVALERYLSEQNRGADEALFLSPKGGRISKFDFYRSWHKIRLDARLPALVPHDLRHLSATFTAQVPGVAMRDVMDRLGHSSMAAAMRYQRSTQGRPAVVADAATEALAQRMAHAS